MGAAYTKEQDEKIINMYNAGCKLVEISGSVGKDYHSVKNRIKRLRDKGYLGFNTEAVKNNRVELYKTIAQDVLTGKYNQSQLAYKYKVSPYTISWYMREMRKLKLIPEVIHVKKAPVPEEVEKKQKVAKARVIVPTLEPGQTIKCTCAVSKMCVYGISNPTGNEPKCRYSAITGKCRSVSMGDFVGCKGSACTQFSKISKENPRVVESESTFMGK